MPGILFIGPISETRDLVGYPVIVVAGRAGHVAKLFVAVRIVDAVETSVLRRRDAD